MVALVEVRLWRRVDQLERPVAAADRRHDERVRLFVELERSGHSGWGEVSPLLSAAGADPSVDEVQRRLTEIALDALVALASREGELPLWSRVHRLASDDRADVWAHAAIEMALLDLDLVESGQSLAQRWMIDADPVPVMATTSLLDFDAGWSPPTGTARVRVKTTRGVDIAAFADTLAQWGVPVLLDFNGTANTVAEALRQVNELMRSVSVDAVEQPFEPGDLVAHSELAVQCPVPVSLDESIRSMLDVRLVVRYRAAQMVCVKPPRMGGLAPARDLLSRCAGWGLSAYVGGFFESTLARAAHRAVAAGFPVGPSDVADVTTSGPAGFRRTLGIGVVPEIDAAQLLFSRSGE